MPELSHAASAKYWYEFIDPMIYRVVTFMDSVESWTLDGDPQLEAAIVTLGKELDQVTSIDINAIGQDDIFIRLISNIKSSRGLRLLQAIDTARPGSAAKVLNHAETTSINSADPSGFFLKRNIIFERLRLLSRIFSSERLNLINRALEGDE
jgi:intracellular multiplication protein IcmW